MVLLDKCFCYHFFLYQCFKICLKKLFIYFQELRGGLYNKHYPNDLTHNVLSHKHYYNDIVSHKHYYNDVLSHRQDNIIGNLFSMQVATLAVVAILLNYAGMVLLIYISCALLWGVFISPQRHFDPTPSNQNLPEVNVQELSTETLSNVSEVRRVYILTNSNGDFVNFCGLFTPGLSGF